MEMLSPTLGWANVPLAEAVTSSFSFTRAFSGMDKETVMLAVPSYTFVIVVPEATCAVTGLGFSVICTVLEPLFKAELPPYCTVRVCWPVAGIALPAVL